MSGQQERTLEEIREALRVRRQPKVGKKIWEPLDPATLAVGAVLSFDQTLSKTGFALVVNDSAGLRVEEANLICPEKIEAKGFEETYQKAEFMERMIHGVIVGTALRATAVVHEMPSVAGYRTESSLMAGHFVRSGTRRFARGLGVTMVSKQRAAALLIPPTQDRTAKANMTEAVNALIPRERRSNARRWNQDVHDAVALAITHLHQESQ